MASTHPRNSSHTAICSLATQNRMVNPVTDAEKVQAIKEIFKRFDWEYDDRQYALEHIERIIEGDENNDSRSPQEGEGPD